MTGLDDLFPGGARRHDAQLVLDDRRATRRLAELVGEARPDLDVTHRASDRTRLVAMVKAAVADAKPLEAVSAGAAAKRRRPRRRIDVVNVGLAALAAVALVVTGVVGGVQAATASPADDALRVLRADEKTIESATSGLEASLKRVAEVVADADADAATLRSAIETARAGSADADVIAISDVAATDTVLAAIDAYRADVKKFELPTMPEGYERPGIADDSLVDVAGAIDAAQLHLAMIDRVSSEARKVRTAIDARKATFLVALTTFATTFTGEAQRVIEAYPDTGRGFRDAVTRAAAAVAGADLSTAQGAATLAPYRDAVVALAAEQARLELQWQRERAERERAARERQWQHTPANRDTDAPDGDNSEANEPEDSGGPDDPEGPNGSDEPEEPVEPTDPSVDPAPQPDGD